MPTRAEIIKQATDAARQDFYHYTATVEDEILQIYRQAADDIGAAILKTAAEDKLTLGRLNGLLRQVKDEIRTVNISLNSKIRQAMSHSVDLGINSSIHGMQSAGLYHGDAAKGIPSRLTVQQGRAPVKVQVGTSYTGKDGKIRRYTPSIELYADSTWSRINTQAMDHLLRFRPSGVTLSKSVWDVTYAHEKFMRRQITQAVLQGKSSAKLSREMRSSLKEPNRLFRRVRGADGKLRWSRAAKAYHPGQGVYRSSYKNAMRVARTETNRAYHEGAVRYAHEKTWIDGAIWRLGNIDACPVCVELADKFYPKSDIPQIPHPHCMCHLEWHIEGDAKPEKGMTPQQVAAFAAA